MPQNYDIIEILSTDNSGGCNCSAQNFQGDFIAKTNGEYIYSLRSSGGETVWTPSTFRIGTTSSAVLNTITIESSSSLNAALVVGSSSDVTNVYPDKVQSDRFEAGTTIIEQGTCVISDLTFNGNIVPGSPNTHDIGSNVDKVRKIWTTDADVSGTLNAGTLTATTFSPVALNVTGASTFGGLATFNANIAVPGTSTLGTASITTGTITTLGATTATLTNATVATAPTTSNDVVRLTDIALTASQTSDIYKISTNANGIIDSIGPIIATDLPAHASEHHSTSRTGTAPPSGGGDSLHSYQIGAVERASPVVKQPLRLTHTTNGVNNYTYADAEPYFVVIEQGETPDASGPEGQIIFRKAQQ